MHVSRLMRASSPVVDACKESKQHGKADRDKKAHPIKDGLYEKASLGVAYIIAS